MDYSRPLRILAIGAHPDDVEFACAGAISRCIQRGDTVTVAIVCRGDSASCGLSPEELAEVRSREAKDACDLLGAELIEMGFPDYGIWYNRESLGVFVESIRRARPEVVLTHYHTDYGGDHNNTFKLTLDATLAASVPNFFTELPPIERIPLLYMMEPIGGYGFQPQVYVDITDTLDIKKEMLGCHRSQMEWMSRYGGMDSKLYVETVARFRGYQSGVEFAEGFIPHPSWGHIPAGRVLP